MQYNALESLQAFEVGQGQRKERERERAMQGVGNALASGNYAGGAGLMFNMGDISGGMQLQQYGKSLEDAEAEKKRVGMIKTGMGLLQTPAEQREAMRPQIAQTLAQIGVQLDPQQIQSMDLSDDGIKATLSSLQDTDSLMAQYQSMMAPPEYGFQSVQGVGLVKTDPRAGTAETVISASPGYEKVTLKDGEYEYIPGQPESLRKLGDSPVKSPLVSVNTGNEKGENKFQEGLGTLASSKYGTILEQGQAASASIGNLDTMDALLDQIDYTGFGGDTLLQVQRIGQMMGIEVPDLPAKEAAKRLSSQMALSLKSDLPGPMSNADREFLLSIPPNLNSTQAGNDAIIFILRKREERKRDMMQSLLQADPRSMEEYRAWENRYLQETPPMFTPATQASLLKALSGASGEDTPQ